MKKFFLGWGEVEKRECLEFGEVGEFEWCFGCVVDVVQLCLCYYEVVFDFCQCGGKVQVVQRFLCDQLVVVVVGVEVDFGDDLVFVVGDVEGVFVEQEVVVVDEVVYDFFDCFGFQVDVL